MDTISGSYINFGEQSVIRDWQPPAGVYRAVFRSSYRDREGRQIILFQITDPADKHYWARHGYREQDLWKLFNHLHRWLGEEEYNRLSSAGGCELSGFYGSEADIEVGVIDLRKKEQLRIILDIAPPGTLIQRVGELIGPCEI